MKYKIKAYSIWEFGQRVDAAGNPHQEDCTYPLPQDLTDDDRLFILCDGMGGHDAGEVASATVCEVLSAAALQAQPDPTGQFSDEIFLDSLAAAYDALDKKDTGAVKKMGTTMTFLKLHADGATIAHMGDSRVYHIRPGKTAEDTQILFQTCDHSLVNDLLRIGELTPEEAKTYPRKNVITRAMQPNMERRCRADIYHTSDIQAGDIFYLCSDGMLENMEDPQICYNFSSEAGRDTDIVNNLTSATQYNRDNHTAFIIRITEVIPPVAKMAVAPESKSSETEQRPQAVALTSSAPVVDTKAQKSKNSPNSKVFVISAVVALFVLIFAIGLYVANRHLDNVTELGPTVSTEQPPTPPKSPAPPQTPDESSENNANPQNNSTQMPEQSQSNPDCPETPSPDNPDTSIEPEGGTGNDTAPQATSVKPDPVGIALTRANSKKENNSPSEQPEQISEEVNDNSNNTSSNPVQNLINEGKIGARNTSSNSILDSIGVKK